MQRPGLFSQPMRRLLLAALVWIGAAVPGVALAQFACNGAVEGFEASVPPSGWSVATSEPGGPQWTTIAGSGETGNYTNGSGGAASVSSDEFGSAEFDTSLVTPAFSLVGFVTAQVDYTVNYQNFAGSDFLDLDISTDGGATWATLLSWNEDHGAHRAPPGEDVTVDLAAYAGQANLQLRWRYYDPNSGDWDWYAQIDDVGLTCGDGTAPDINIGTTSMAASQAPNTTTSQTLVIDNTGTAALNWAIDEEPVVRPGPDAPAAGGSTEKLGAPIQTPLSPGRLAKLQADTMAANVVQDGSFEAGTPNPFWTEASTNYGTPLCTVAGCGTGTGTGPRTGDWWAWFGGSSSAEAASVSQSVTIPAGGVATLTFWTEQMVCSPAGAADYLEVLVDGTQLWLTTAADPACGVLGYRQITLDLGAYADGGAHTVTFNSVTIGSGISNFFVDDVTLGAPEPCDSPASVPWLSFTPASGTTAAGGSSNVTVGFDSSGMTAGTYNANLCVTSDDPDPGPGNGTDLVVVPVELTVTALAAPPRLVPTFGPVGGTLLGLLLAGFGLFLLRRYQR